ncbi:unnamed protein product [Sympodiomycopsis kandeliae]
MSHTLPLSRPLAGSSSSSIAPPHNLLNIFQAHFHVRRGNEITFQHGHQVNLTGVEWSVLPSGSHALDSDLIWFTPPSQDDGIDDDDESQITHNRIGVAVFQNRRLQEEEEEDELDQRGARMIAVGFVAVCHDKSPSAILSACLPHLESLYQLAEQSSSQPSNQDLLINFYNKHKFDPSQSYQETLDSLQQLSYTRSPHLFSKRPHSRFDPILDLPAIANALGLILPDLLRTLLVSDTRLLIFTPTGINTSTAASLAWNLAEIVQAALAAQQEDDDDQEADQDDGEEEEEETTPLRPKSAQQHRSPPRVRGILSLQDIALLEDEEKLRAETRFQAERHHSHSRPSSHHSWIAYSTDRLFLEKPHLYDYILDLSPLCAATTSTTTATPSATSSPSSSQRPGSSAIQPVLLAYTQSSTPSSSPIFSRAERALKTLPDGRDKTIVKLRRQAWHPRDFAIYRANELRSVKLASRPKSLVRRSSRSSVALRSAATSEISSSDGVAKGPHVKDVDNKSISLPRISSPAALLSTLLAFVRYYLSSLWFIPHQWRINLRESYGYVPLSIRPDGGVQAGLMILPDSDSESESDGDGEGDEDSDKDEDIDEGGEGRAETNRQRVPSQSSHSLKRSSRHREASPDETDFLEVHGQPRKHLSPGASPRQSLRSINNATSPHSSDLDIDPILAACGAGPSSSSRRLSVSGGTAGASGRRLSASSSGRGPIALPFDRALDSGEDGDLTDSTVTTVRSRAGDNRSPSKTQQDPTEEAHTPSHHQESARPRRPKRPRPSSTNLEQDTYLSRSIYTIWSEWLSELAINLEGLSVEKEDDIGKAIGSMGLNVNNRRDLELVFDWTKDDKVWELQGRWWMVWRW